MVEMFYLSFFYSFFDNLTEFVGDNDSTDQSIGTNLGKPLFRCAILHFQLSVEEVISEEKKAVNSEPTLTVKLHNHYYRRRYINSFHCVRNYPTTHGVHRCTVCMKYIYPFSSMLRRLVTYICTIRYVSSHKNDKLIFCPIN